MKATAISALAKRIATMVVDELDKYSMINSDIPGVVADEERAWCCKQIEPIIAAEIWKEVRQ